MANTCEDKSDTFSSEVQPNHLEDDLMEEKLKEEFEYVTNDDNVLERGTMEMGFNIVDSTPQDLEDNAFEGVTHEQVHIEVTFMSNYGKDTLIDGNMEHTSFHLKKDMETARSFQEKKFSHMIESTIEFDNL